MAKVPITDNPMDVNSYMSRMTLTTNTSTTQLLCRVSIIHTEGRALLVHTLFENTIPFCISVTYLLFLLFVVAKRLAMCRLGGVISAQIVLF